MKHYYSTDIMDDIWSEERLHHLWTYLWHLTGQFGPAPKKFLTPEERASWRSAAANSKHEVVAALADHYAVGGNPNAHLGLTSSDITDNARMIACVHSMSVLIKAAAGLRTALIDDDRGYTMAYTHLLPAKRVPTAAYINTWFALLLEASRPDVYPLRGFRGSVGDRHLEEPRITAILERATKELLRLTPDTGAYLSSENDLLLQTWSPLSAHKIISRIQEYAIVLNKIAEDYRSLISLGAMTAKTKDRTASSTLTHKRRNPAVFERCIGQMRMVTGHTTTMLHTLLDQKLSRTLDDSSVWRELLPATFGMLHNTMLALIDETPKWSFVDVMPEFANEEITNMRRVLDGRESSRAACELKTRSL